MSKPAQAPAWAMKAGDIMRGILPSLLTGILVMQAAISSVRAADSVSVKQIASDSARLAAFKAERARLGAEIDSLKASRDRTDNAIDSLEDRGDAIDDSIENIEDDLDNVADRVAKSVHQAVNDMRRAAMDVAHAARTARDTVLVVTQQTVNSITGPAASGTTASSRKRGYGGCAGTEPGFFAVDFGPVRELIANSSLLRDSIGFTIDHRWAPVVFNGGVAYGGVGYGVRIGAGGWGGSKSFFHTVNDTAYRLSTGIGMGALLLEKAWVVDRVNWFAGGMIGAGGMGVELSTSTSAFDIGDNSRPRLGAVGCGFMLAEAHVGMTWSLLSWMHVGAQAAAPCFISSEGLRNSSMQSVTNGFFSVNPGVRLRLVLGNLG